MKKIIFCVFISVTLLSCSRKQDLRELGSSEVLAKYPLQCYNGMQDSTETGVDCGGPCTPCNTVTPTCSPLPNSLTIGTSTSSAAVSSCGPNSGYYQMSGSYSGGSFTINLGSSAPDLSIAYNIIASSVLSSSEASVSINDSWLGGLSPNTGTLYMSYSGGKYTGTICGASAYSWVTSQSYAIEGKVTCP